MVLWWIGNVILLVVVLPVVIYLLNRVLAALERIRAASDNILAELVQLRASGALAPGPAAPERTAARPAAARNGPSVDPVCGMTVAADASGRPLEHDGVTYHFCGAGCRRAFADNPAAYLKRETRC